MWLFFLLMIFGSVAYGAPILLDDQPLEPPLETRSDLDAKLETALDGRISLLDLARFGVDIQTSSLDDALRMQHQDLRLDWRSDMGWVTDSGEVLQGWNAPVQKDKITYVPLKCLRPLGFDLSLLENGAIATRAKTTVPPGGYNQIVEVQAQKSRLTLRFLRSPNFFALEKTATRYRLRLGNTTTTARFWAIGSSSLSRVRLLRDGNHATLEAELPQHAKLEISSNNQELILEGQDQSQPIPPVPANLPNGIEYKTVPAGLLSKLHLIRLDPTRYHPEVRTAPWGGAKGILEFANGAVAAVNGGYFDPASMQAVDLLFDGSLQAYARGNRATVGFLDQTALFGLPRARLVLTLGAAVANINQIRPTPHPQNLTFFIGDGFLPIGGLGYTTYVLANGKILERRDDAFVPKNGQMTVSFNPKTNPSFERKVGEPANVGLTWGDPAWEGVASALAAGPRLVANGIMAVDAKAEGFDSSGEIWRPTRQVAIGIDKQGFYVLAMLEWGSPEDFAKALLANGLRDAMRLDSGTSAQIALAGGLVAGRLGRVVPNAIVFSLRENSGVN
jgi:Phosphodiester glycosidase